jgi:hypothetical protein
MCPFKVIRISEKDGEINEKTRSSSSATIYNPFQAFPSS